MIDPTTEFRDAAGFDGDSTTTGSGIIGAHDPAAGAVTIDPDTDRTDLTRDSLGTARRLVKSYNSETRANERRAQITTASSMETGRSDSDLKQAAIVVGSAIGLGILGGML
jgi:hypothetical protein